MDNKYVNKCMKKIILIVKSAMKTIQQDNIKEQLESWTVGINTLGGVFWEKPRGQIIQHLVGYGQDLSLILVAMRRH